MTQPNPAQVRPLPAQAARGTNQTPDGALVGQPASAGPATGPVHLVHGPDEFADFADGNVLVAKATAPAWTHYSRTPAPWSPTAAPWPASLVARR